MLLSQTGINLVQQYSYGGDQVWVDLRHALSQWLKPDKSADIPATNLTPQGYPTVDAMAILSSVYGYLPGVYPVSYAGTATLTFSGVASLTTPFTLGADGRYHGAVTMNPTSTGMLIVRVTGLDSSNQFQNLRIISPGYGDNPTQLFTDPFLHTLDPFSYLRFLQWSGTIGSTFVNWSDRIQPGAYLNSNGGGVTYEDMITLCNLKQKDMWINVPVMATDDYVRQLADLIDSRLDPSLKVYVEYSNETWNTAFPDYYKVLAKARANPLVTASSDIYAVAQQTAVETKRVADLFKQEFGADSARILPVLPGWGGYSPYNQVLLDFYKSNYGNPADSAYALAIAPYIEPAIKSASGLTADSIIASMNNFLDTTLVAWIDQSNAIAKQFGVPLITYEGGNGIHTNSSTYALIQKTTTNDPRMYDLFKRLRTVWDAHAGGSFTYFALNDNYWGLLTSVNTPGSHKWDAVMSAVLPAGDADYDGSVTTADRGIVLANLGKSGAWWSQGDFNHDRVVNGADLAIVDQALGLIPAVVYSGSDVSTKGNWQGTYGGDGYFIVGGASSLPSYATVGPTSATTTTWSNSTTDIRALANPGSPAGARSVACWYSATSFTIDVNISDGQAHAVSLYMLDWNTSSRAQSIQVFDADTGALMDTRSLSSFNGGVYMTWDISSHVRIVLSRTGGFNAVVSGLFFGHAPQGTIGTTAASYVRSDSTTRGGWEGIYGGDGYTIVNGASVTPTYAQSGISGAATSIWSNSTTDVRALALAGSPAAPRTVACWYSATSFTIDVNIRDGQSHAVSLYMLDWNTSSRAQTIQVVDADTGTVLDTRSLSSFNGGTYMTWNVSGHVRIVLSRTGGFNAVASGIFFGYSPRTSTGTSTASFVRSDAATQGKWEGAYGRDGYTLAGLGSSAPNYGTASLSGETAYTWSTSTTDVRALTKPGSPTAARPVVGWYSATSFTIDVNISDGQAHAVSLYMLDWNTNSRAQTIQVVNADTGAVLDTRSVSSFNGGRYMTWNVSGRVRFVVTRTGGYNAVVNGVFFG